jgi:hypothetical protein
VNGEDAKAASQSGAEAGGLKSPPPAAGGPVPLDGRRSPWQPRDRCPSILLVGRKLGTGREGDRDGVDWLAATYRELGARGGFCPLPPPPLLLVGLINLRKMPGFLPVLVFEF